MLRITGVSSGKERVAAFGVWVNGDGGGSVKPVIYMSTFNKTDLFGNPAYENVAAARSEASLSYVIKQSQRDASSICIASRNCAENFLSCCFPAKTPFPFTSPKANNNITKPAKSPLHRFFIRAKFSGNMPKNFARIKNLCNGDLAGFVMLLFALGLVKGKGVLAGKQQERKFSAQFRDAMHIEEASRCDCFITYDKDASDLAAATFSYAGFPTKSVLLKVLI